LNYRVILKYTNLKLTLSFHGILIQFLCIPDNFVVNGVIQDVVTLSSRNQDYVVVSVDSQNGQAVTSQHPIQLNAVNGEVLVAGILYCDS